MKNFKQAGKGRRVLARWLPITAVAFATLFGFSVSAQAQNCVIDNWLGGPTALSNADAGTQGTSNRRYGGPCGLRVPVDGTARYVTDNSPATETTYIARFYVFLDNAPAGPIVLFAADDGGGTDQIQVIHHNGDLILKVWDQANADHDLVVPSAEVGSGWHSVEFAWEQAASASIAFSVNGAPDVTTTIDTSGISISNASLGNINNAAGTGSIDFDDFDSRRVERPGRLMIGDANNDLAINSQDFVTVINEISGGPFSAGQPDCNEDGVINSQDFVCIINIISGN